VKSAAQIAGEVNTGATSAVAELTRSLEAVRARNDELPGPLAGVPIAIKDNMCQRGVPTTCASKILQGWRPPYSATVVEKLLAAGAVPVGKTNLDEFAMGSSTENSAFGPTRNPWTGSRVPGGSSGGSAAAVAADMTPIAIGSDTGGSIRQPAALCGVVGVKPTYGLVSRYGLVAFASSLDQIGPFAKTVTDAAPCSRCSPATTRSTRPRCPSRRPRWSPTSTTASRVSASACPRADRGGPTPRCSRRSSAGARGARAAGATTSSSRSPNCAGLSAYYLIAPAEASSNLARYDGVRYGLRVDGDDVAAMNEATRTAGFGAEVKRRIMLGTYALSAGYYDAYYGQALKVRTQMIDAFARAYREVDLLLGATTPTVAFAFGAKTANPLSMYLSDVFTIPTNLAGEAAISVPFGTGEGAARRRAAARPRSQ
jgi:aspartyl-tRNA(Asn)/glutamyl-tRNA(Gln) amidotransferase subunit A